MDTEVKAVGNTPEIGENGNWFIDGEDTGYPAVARDGVTPTVGENGNWWLGDLDTGVPAKGQDGEKGEDGKDGTVAAGIDGAQINEEGDLILTLADGTTINAGRVRDDRTIPSRKIQKARRLPSVQVRSWPSVWQVLLCWGSGSRLRSS